MRRTNLMLVVIAVSAVGWMLPSNSFGQAAAAKVEVKAEEAADEKEPSGRLPAHYKDIVTADQKEKIYAVQADFNKQIDALAEQIKKLQADRAAAVEAVLTPEQKKKLAEAKAAAAKIKATDEGKLLPLTPTPPTAAPTTSAPTTKPAPAPTPKPVAPPAATKK